MSCLILLSLCSMLVFATALWMLVILSPMPWKFSALPSALSNIQCVETDQEILYEVLGPSYNRRYMSVDKPPDFNSRIPGIRSPPFNEDTDVEKMQSDQKVGTSELVQRGRRTTDSTSFFVDANYERPIKDDEVAGLSVSLALNGKQRWKSRHKRNAVKKVFPVGARKYDSEEADDSKTVKLWGCNSTVIWLDLGEDHFPRYLRGVECSRSQCWFGHFSCKARAFTTNVLKRVSDTCAAGGPWENEVGKVTRAISKLAGVPQDLTERWQFVEVGVTFCCECVQSLVHEN